MKRTTPRGGFVTGLVVGLLIGLAVALAIALYVTQAPVPFVNKLPQRTAEQDAAEAQHNRNWDPNAVLAGKNQARPAAPAASAAPAAAPQGVPPPGIAPAPVAPPTAARAPRDAAAILAGQTPPPAGVASAAAGFDYWVQTGAYARSEDAESQRARLGMLGQSARVLEREQAGRPVFRVRIGPFQARSDAEDVQSQLTAAGFESNLVRVER